MIRNAYTIEFLTPCFCAGATQSLAEVRAPSIRGKLRWWFRVIGGTAEQEREVFGSVRGENASGSSLIVRVSEASLAPKWLPIQFTGISNTGYVLYFAKASADGTRWVAGGAISPGAKFVLTLTWQRSISTEIKAIFDLALKCFLTLGSLGLRSTRGLGAFECREMPFSTEAFNKLLSDIRQQSKHFQAGFGEFTGTEAQWLDGLGSQLRGLRQGYSAGTPSRPAQTPLGASQPRQASAVHMRPVRDNGKARIVVFEAPAEKVLGSKSRSGAPRLSQGVPKPGMPPAKHQ